MAHVFVLLIEGECACQLARYKTKQNKTIKPTPGPKVQRHTVFSVTLISMRAQRHVPRGAKRAPDKSAGQSLRAWTSRLKDSFTQRAVRKLNSPPVLPPLHFSCLSHTQSLNCNHSCHMFTHMFTYIYLCHHAYYVFTYFFFPQQILEDFVW